MTDFPHCDIENAYAAESKVVCGMDEVGRGAWAGPLVMAAVIPGPGVIPGVRDSKKIAEKKRVRLRDEIYSWAKGIGIGEVTNDEIDRWGMAQSLRVAAMRTIEDLEKTSVAVDVVLLDGIHNFFGSSKEVVTIVKGDNVSHSIAAASIVAKVHRDSYMASEGVAGKYPSFCFESNKGYPAPIHREQLAAMGPTSLHRISWKIL